MSDDFAPARGRKNRPAKRAVGASPYDEGAKGLMDDQEMAEAKDIVLEPMTDVCEVSFAPLAEGEVTDAHLKPAAKMSGKGVVQIRKIGVPPNRISPLKKEWVNLTTPLVKEMKLAVQFNRKSKQVLLVPAWVVSAEKKEPTESEARLLEIYLEKACLYVKGFLLGFSLSDCMALLRLDDIYLQSFQVSDVKRLVNDNMSRAIGRIAGTDGKTRNAIQNSTRTRIVIADKHIHLLGGYDNIKLARGAICSLILGSPPSKVYQHLNVVSRRMKERA